MYMHGFDLGTQSQVTCRLESVSLFSVELWQAIRDRITG